MYNLFKYILIILGECLLIAVLYVLFFQTSPELFALNTAALTCAYLANIFGYPSFTRHSDTEESESAGYGIYDDKHANMSVFVNLFPVKARGVLKVLAYVLLLFVNVYWIYYGISLSSLTSMARMSATGWPQSLTYISIVVGGIYGLLMTIGRLLKGGFNG